MQGMKPVPDLVLGPLLRYVGADEATVWVETSEPCEVEVLGHRSRTFSVEGHHYALVVISGLEPGGIYEYEVLLDGVRHWPEADSRFPPSVIRTIDPGGDLGLIFGSCRVAQPDYPPYTLTKDEDERGLEVDALQALALRMRGEPPERWPHVLMLVGDQVYADQPSPATKEFIRSRRDFRDPPGEEAVDFEEYAYLYQDSWSDPEIRWLFSTVSSSMIFDDHEIQDNWNGSIGWFEEHRQKPWWDEKMAGALSAYWVYQHLGNLSPAELEQDDLWPQVEGTPDAGPVLRDMALRVAGDPEAYRFSFYRDLGGTRLIVMDSRAGRKLEPGRRRMVHDADWDWISDHTAGDFDHLLFATSIPFLVSPGYTTPNPGTTPCATARGARWWREPARNSGSARTSDTGAPSPSPSGGSRNSCAPSPPGNAASPRPPSPCSPATYTTPTSQRPAFRPDPA